MAEDIDAAFGGQDPFATRPHASAEPNVVNYVGIGSSEEPNQVDWPVPEPSEHPLSDSILNVHTIYTGRKGVTVVWVEVTHESDPHMKRGACGVARKMPGYRDEPRLARKVAVCDALDALEREMRGQ